MTETKKQKSRKQTEEKMPPVSLPSDAVEFLMETAVRLFWVKSEQDETPEIRKMNDRAKDRAQLNKKSLQKLGYKTQGGADLIEYTQKLNVYNTVLYRRPDASKTLYDAFNLADDERYTLGGHGQDLINENNRDEILSTLICVHEMAVRSDPKSEEGVGMRVLNEFLQSVKDIGGDNAFVRADLHNRNEERAAVKKNYLLLCDQLQRNFPKNPVAQVYLKTKLLPPEAK